MLYEVITTHYGGLDALQVVEEERPEPKHGEVRVRVLAAGVSLPDIMAREGIRITSYNVCYTKLLRPQVIAQLLEAQT